MAKDMRYIVAAFDPDDLPRAFGIANTVADARKRCESELALYRAERCKVADSYLAGASYTLRVAIVGDAESVWRPL